MLSQISHRVVRVGAQKPGNELRPRSVSSAGADAVELAASCGLVLDEWQQHVLEGALGERADGRWSAFEACLIVPRQNGKGSVLAARELAGLVLFSERLIIHSAHKFSVAQEHFRRMRDLIDQSADISRLVKRIYYAAGQECIEMRSGARLRFEARTAAAVRGFTADLVVFDEAFSLTTEAMAATIPALAAVDNPQVWYASSAPEPDSSVLHRLRERALLQESERFYFAEWACDRGVDLVDRDNWYKANPALGIRLDEEYVALEHESLRDMGDAFAHQRLGIVAQVDAKGDAFGAGLWAECVVKDSQIVEGLAFGLDVSHDMRWAAISAAGKTAAGSWHVEVIERLPGTDWVAERAAQLCHEWQATLAVDLKSPAAVLLEDLSTVGVPVVSPTASDLILTCGRLRRMVVERKLAHLGQSSLDMAVAGAATRPVGDGWLWARARSSTDVSALVAATLALWSASAAPVVESSLAESVW